MDCSCPLVSEFPPEPEWEVRGLSIPLLGFHIVQLSSVKIGWLSVTDS